MSVISTTLTVREALERLNQLVVNLILFVTDEDRKLVGTVTDGDVRRGLINGVSLESPVEMVMNKDFSYINTHELTSQALKNLRTKHIYQVPILDDKMNIVKILDLNKIKGFIPVDAVIMAGGEGTRLRPLTLDVPKPLLKVGEKPIIDHNIDRLISYGVTNFFITVKYLAEKISGYLGNGRERNSSINYFHENIPKGTIGALGSIEEFFNDDVLVMNSDLLTNIDFEDFYSFFKSSNADMAVATTPYNVNVPYAVLELDIDRVKSLKEKPTYTYYSNAGIYLIKKEVIGHIPKNTFYNATDLMELVIEKGLKLVSYPILGYWLDIGNHADFSKAQDDIKHIQLY